MVEEVEDVLSVDVRSSETSRWPGWAIGQKPNHQFPEWLGKQQG